MVKRELGGEVTNEFQILVDSDVFVGWVWPDDVHHKRSVQVFASLRAKKCHLITTSMVIAETATVLSHRDSQATARAFLDEVIAFPTIHISEDLQQEAIGIFRKQTQRGTSVTDCANVAVMRRFNIPHILSFDRVYFKSFGLKSVI
jgi:predicted nucleic acid-binding protein